MKKYKVYRIKPELKQLLQHYPKIEAKIMSLEPTNNYYTKQMDCFFYHNEGVNDYLISKLQHRNDYHHDKNKHFLLNDLTKQQFICIIDEYYIQIEANKKDNVFLEIIYNLSIDKDDIYIDET